MRKLVIILTFMGSFGYVSSSYSQASVDPGDDGDYGYMCCIGGPMCTDESGIVWLEDRKVERTKQGDTC